MDKQGFVWNGQNKDRLTYRSLILLLKQSLFKEEVVDTTNKFTTYQLDIQQNHTKDQ